MRMAARQRNHDVSRQAMHQVTFRCTSSTTGAIYPSTPLLQIRCVSSVTFQDSSFYYLLIPISVRYQKVTMYIARAVTCHFGHFNCSCYLLPYIHVINRVSDRLSSASSTCLRAPSFCLLQSANWHFKSPALIYGTNYCHLISRLHRHSRSLGRV